eukprot:TRINITY_DN68190_c0_g1_i1.p1 TRINITY_DN68190_c0_g1~~TRINITY_DN68190_c0_g1_i1.p1  ORF type:complete len:275 (-),score=13.84 TRINITY_DN68190_c0_g1_i1:38-862(-)
MDRMGMSLDDIMSNNKKSNAKFDKKKNFKGGNKKQPVKAARPVTKQKIVQPYEKINKNINKTIKTSREGSIFDRLGNNGTSGTTVILSNLNSDITANDIVELCGRNGEVKRVELKYNNKTGKSIGVAEILFARQSEATNCVKELDGVPLDGKPMNARISGLNGKEYPIDVVTQPRATGKNVRVGLFGTANMDNNNDQYKVKLIQPYENNNNNNNNNRNNNKKSQFQKNYKRGVKQTKYTPNYLDRLSTNNNNRNNNTKTAEDLDAEMDEYMANK